MLNETASSADDRPALRSTGRLMLTEDDAVRQDVRDAVAAIMVIERESATPDMALLARDHVQVMSPDMQPVALFEGRLILDSEAAYAQLDARLAPLGFLPVFRIHDGAHIVHVLDGRTTPKPRPWQLNALLFVLTAISVLILGTEMALSEIGADNPALARQLADNFAGEVWRGLPYAISILLILGAHELGHYFAARYHQINVTLPYFIPAPFISFLGTFGAFIQLREPMRNRKALLDVGAAGPLTGLVFAIPILIIGLATSPIRPISPNGVIEGNSFLYALAKTLVYGRFVPDGQVDVYINQLAMAGWAGLLVTAINLIPIGQLDGGHILFALIGDRARRLYFPLIVGAVILAFISEAWILWVILLFLFGRVYAAPLDMITPLDPRRRWLAVLSLVVFVVTFVPIPLSAVNIAVEPAPRNSVELIPVLTAAAVLLWQRLRR